VAPSIFPCCGFSKFNQCVIHQLFLDGETVDYLQHLGETGCGEVLRSSASQGRASGSGSPERRRKPDTSEGTDNANEAGGQTKGKLQQPSALLRVRYGPRVKLYSCLHQSFDLISGQGLGFGGLPKHPTAGEDRGGRVRCICWPWAEIYDS
jgi:hypothetical protein